MSEKYIHIYNNLINFTRNKDLYKSLGREDNFSDRLTLFLLHFSFFLKNFKNEENKNVLQEIYDFNFKQLELSIREMGYGDITINKKMKIYINIFHAILEKIDNWENLPDFEKSKILSNFLNINEVKSNLIDYFNNYLLNLSNNTLNYYIKGVIKHKF
jgi:cytochrome b pre-mRNA-processing protein 3